MRTLEETKGEEDGGEGGRELRSEVGGIKVEEEGLIPEITIPVPCMSQWLGERRGKGGGD